MLCQTPTFFSPLFGPRLLGQPQRLSLPDKASHVEISENKATQVIFSRRVLMESKFQWQEKTNKERPLMHCRVRLRVSCLAFAHCVKFLPFHFRGWGSACCLKALLLITTDPIFYLCFLVFHQGSSLPSPKLMPCIPSVQRHASKRLTPVSAPFKYW